jgi:hypothetical protein
MGRLVVTDKSCSVPLFGGFLMSNVMPRKVLLWLFCSILGAARAECTYETFGQLSLSNFPPTSYASIKPCQQWNGVLVVFVQYLSAVNKDNYNGSLDSLDLLSSRGGELAERDEYFVYRNLAKKLAEVGFAVLRYDALGVGCASGEVAPFGNPYCVKRDVTAKVRRQHFSALLNSLVLTELGRLGPGSVKQIIYMAHSAASYILADSLEISLVAPSAQTIDLGFVGISALIDSPASGLRYQKVGYWMDRFSGCPASVYRRCVTDLMSDLSFDSVFGGNTRRKVLSILNLTAGDKGLMIRRLLDKTAAESEGGGPKRVISAEAAGGLILIDPSLVDFLFRGTARIPKGITRVRAARLIYGDQDLSLSGVLQRQAWVEMGRSPEDVMILHGLGHSLGKSQYWGPTSPVGIDTIVNAVRDVSEELSR